MRARQSLLASRGPHAGQPVNMEQWETCSVQVGGTNVPDCPVGKFCNHNGHVGKFMTWSVPGRTECHCKYDGGTEGHPCRGNNPCYCTKQTQDITVAPVEESNLPDILAAGGNDYFLVGNDGCPCPEDTDYEASVSKATSHASAF